MFPHTYMDYFYSLWYIIFCDSRCRLQVYEARRCPAKQILRECLGVAGSVVGGTFILEQFNSTISEGGGKGTFVFTDEPQF